MPDRAIVHAVGALPPDDRVPPILTVLTSILLVPGFHKTIKIGHSVGWLQYAADTECLYQRTPFSRVGFEYPDRRLSRLDALLPSGTFEIIEMISLKIA